VAFLSLDIHHCANAAVIVFKGGFVEAVLSALLLDSFHLEIPLSYYLIQVGTMKKGDSQVGRISASLWPSPL
jgi:hypothetical protein